MFKNNIDFNKLLKPALIGYAVFIIIGIVCSIVLGVNLSIDFKGGTRLAYSYEGAIDLSAVDAFVEKTIGQKVDITENSGLTDNSKKLVITLAGDSSLATDTQKKLDTGIVKSCGPYGRSFTYFAFFFSSSKAKGPCITSKTAAMITGNPNR